MTSLNKYIAYLKNNPKRYWFRRKIWGWGWTPATWEGWLTTFIFIAVVVTNAIRFESAEASGTGNVELFMLQTIIFIIIFLLIAWQKGEPPKWQWGIPKEDRYE